MYYPPPCTVHVEDCTNLYMNATMARSCAGVINFARYYVGYALHLIH